MKGQQTVLHKLMFGNLGTAIWELLLSSNSGCQIDVHGNWEGFEVGSRQGKHPACSPQAACRPCNQHADDSILMQTIQSSCRPSNHHADHTTTMQSPCKLCNHHAIAMQSPCNHHAGPPQSPHAAEDTLQHRARHTQSNRATSLPKSSLVGFLGGCKTTPVDSVVDGWVHPAVHLINR